MAKRKISLLGRLLLLLNILAALFLLFIYLSTRISPTDFWPIAFAGLLYPMVLIVNVAFVLYWLLFRRMYFFISLIVILLGYNHVQSFFQWKTKDANLPQSGTNIHVLSYNVSVFDLYNYGPQWSLNFHQRNNIFNFLHQHDFDIICFQEFVHDSTGAFKTLDTLPTFLKAQHVHTGFTSTSRSVNYFGLATFSRFPIIKKQMIRFPTHMGNLCIYSDIVLDSNDTIRVYNVHFESIGLSPEDLIFVENMVNVEQISDHKTLKSGGVKILGRMKRAYIQRAIQVELVVESIKNSPYPVILAGDFNDTPVSYAYGILSKYLNDAFLSGRGTGTTYARPFPGFRIDYIKHSDDFTSHNFVTGNQPYSDHFPVSVWLNIDKK